MVRGLGYGREPKCYRADMSPRARRALAWLRNADGSRGSRRG